MYNSDIARAPKKRSSDNATPSEDEKVGASDKW